MISTNHCLKSLKSILYIVPKNVIWVKIYSFSLKSSGLLLPFNSYMFVS